jgi:hypothetical protein
MDDKIEQSVCIKFCMKVGKSAIETLEMLQEASGEHSLSSQTLLGSVRSLPGDLNIRCIAAKFVPLLLTKDQKQWRVNVSWATGEG